MRRLRCASWVLAAALLLGACSEQEVTQIVVVVDSDYTGFERVEVAVDGFTMDTVAAAELADAPLPRRVTLVHDGGKLGPIAVTVSAFVTGAVEPALVERRADIFFARDRALLLKVDLLFECIGKCPEACIAGPTCVTAAEATELTAWDSKYDRLKPLYTPDGGASVNITDGGFMPVAPDAGPIDDGGAIGDAGADAGPGGGASGGGGGSGEGGEGGEGGGEPDAGPDPLFPFDPSNFDAELLRDLDLAAVSIDCDTATFDSSDLSFGDWCGEEPEAMVVEQSDDTELVVLAMRSLTIEAGATLRLVGERPVALAVLGDAAVAGAIDARATADVPGAGSWPTCPSGASPGPNASGGDAAGGGSGGGFGTPGGAGGEGYAAGVNVSGGAVAGNASLSPLRGGCPGGTGGNGDGAGGLGGAGGGAFQLTVAGELTISGELLASGGGGQAGTDPQDGGGGGGSGGAILIEAEGYDIHGDAVIAANGGSGGGGQPSSFVTVGMSASGEAGAAATSAALGGAAAGSGGDGGDGAALLNHALDGVDGVISFISGGAGGGGGGGVGRILVRGAGSCAPAGVLSPQPSIECPDCSPECPRAPEHGCVGADSGNAFYYVCWPEVPFAEARSKCADAGLTLVRVDDETENDWLADRGLQSLWIGATDTVDEDDWRWLSGDEAFWSGDQGGAAVDGAFNAWGTNEPSGTGDAARLVAATGQWEDQDEGDDYPYVCELSP